MKQPHPQQSLVDAQIKPTDDLQHSILKSFVMCPRAVLDAIEQGKLTAEDFTNPVWNEAFTKMRDAQTNDQARLYTLLSPYEAVITDSAVDALDNVSAWYLIDQLKRDNTNRAALGKLFYQLFDNKKESWDNRFFFMKEAYEKRHDVLAKHFSHEATKGSGIRLCDLAPSSPDELAARALFNGERRWLSKGGGCVLTAETGVGKSVLSMQMALSFANGRPVFGIKPNRSLKVGIIQAEDDKDELCEFRDSICEGFRREGWTEEDIRRALENVTWETGFVGKAGDTFCQALRTVQEKKKYDLIIVNPLQSFYGGDIVDNKDMTHFLREGIDPIIQSSEYGCAILFIHHANKGAGDWSKNKKAANDVYNYAGATDLSNWERAAFRLKVKDAERGIFTLVATKRGQRLGWKDAKGQPTIKKTIAHSEDILYWREIVDEETGEESAAEGAHLSKEDFLKCAAEEVAKQIKSKTSATQVRAWAKEQFSKNKSEEIMKLLTTDPYAYGIRSWREKNCHYFEPCDQLPLRDKDE